MSLDNPPVDPSARLTEYAAVVREYQQLHPYFEDLAGRLSDRLRFHCGHLGLHAMVEGRAKAVLSFAEKIIRKPKADPFAEIMDLCGARVITKTLGEVHRLCEVVRTDPWFTILPDHSADKLAHLSGDQFGYLSVHYVVRLSAEAFPAPELRQRLAPREVVAEIQLRTLLQHAWADIQHGLVYKRPIPLPEDLRREFARLAAVLEDADRRFEQLCSGVEKYAADYLAYRDRDTLRAELDHL
jgi:ppGpp synthetase/RelA/SpoT-type nucleotidyltranferase